MRGKYFCPNFFFFFLKRRTYNGAFKTAAICLLSPYLHAYSGASVGQADLLAHSLCSTTKCKKKKKKKQKKQKKNQDRPFWSISTLF